MLVRSVPRAAPSGAAHPRATATLALRLFASVALLTLLAPSCSTDPRTDYHRVNALVIPPVRTVDAPSPPLARAAPHHDR